MTSKDEVKHGIRAIIERNGFATYETSKERDSTHFEIRSKNLREFQRDGEPYWFDGHYNDGPVGFVIQKIGPMDLKLFFGKFPPLRRGGILRAGMKPLLVEGVLRMGSKEETYFVAYRTVGYDSSDRPYGAVSLLVCGKRDHDTLLQYADAGYVSEIIDALKSLFDPREKIQTIKISEVVRDLKIALKEGDYS